jgi:hypothetical protein
VHHIEHRRCLVQGAEIEPKWGRAGAHALPAVKEAA